MTEESSSTPEPEEADITLRDDLHAAIDRILDAYVAAPESPATLQRQLFGAVQVVLRERFPAEVILSEPAAETELTPPGPGSVEEAAAKLRATIGRIYEDSKPGVARGAAFAMTQMPKLAPLIVPMLRRFMQSPAQQEAAKVAVTRILVAQAHLSPRVAAQMVELAARMAQRMAAPKEEGENTEC